MQTPSLESGGFHEHLSEEEFKALALAGALREDVQIHSAAVDEFRRHAGIAEGLLEAADHILSFLPLHVHVVAQLVRPLLTLSLRVRTSFPVIFSGPKALLFLLLL